jgi:hypothetical protein
MTMVHAITQFGALAFLYQNIAVGGAMTQLIHF